MPATPASFRPSTPRGFTLIELMISIALVLVLILGINQVFQYTLAAVGAGQSLGTSIRDSRAAQTAFTTDLSNAATTDGPFFIIHSAQTYAFRNRADFASDKDGFATTIDLNGNGKEGDTIPGENIGPTTYNFRNHRVDVLEFFARGQYSAQTGYTQLVYPPSVSSNEACIWYGFLKLPDNTYNSTTYLSANYPPPGLSSFAGLPPITATAADNPSVNPNNFFATDWVLGRVARLLLPTPAAAGAAMYVNNTSYIPGGPITTATKLSPLADSSMTNITESGGPSPAWQNQWSRCDVAQTSIADYSTLLSGWITANDLGNGAPYPPNDYWNRMFIGSYGLASGTLFQCNPFITASTAVGGSPQLTPAKMARTTPYFLKGCTQFIVEFAGDFVKQDDNPTSLTYGQVLDIVTTSNGKADGIDFELVPNVQLPRNQWQRRIRWYGLPRSLSGSAAKILGNPGTFYNPGSPKTFMNGLVSDSSATVGSPPSVPPTDSSTFTEVIPLRDTIAASPTACANLQTVLRTAATSGPQPQWIERYTPVAPTAAQGGNYAVSMSRGTDYLVTWGPDSDAAGIPRPKMIRIIITLDDANNQSTDGQTYEYVFTLP